METKIVQTSQGPVEYSTTGKGSVVLYIHGGHSGDGTGRNDFLQESLLERGYRLVVPFRPGYGKTPIELGKTAADQAEVLKRMLETLEIPKVAVIGESAGGPTALEFARQFPAAAHCLILEEAITKTWVPKLSPQYWAMKWIFDPKRQARFWKGQREAFARNPKAELLALAKLFSTRPPGEVLVDWGVEGLEDYRRALEGFDSGAGFVHTLDHLPSRLEEITIPVLIMHSRHDRNVPFEHALHAHRRIRGSELYEIPSLSHLIYMGRGKSTVAKRRLEFLKQVGW